MGNCFGGGTAIDKEIKKDKDNEKSKIKILLLGAGESGKTTLFKQMKLLYTDSKEFSPAERNSFKKIITKNIFQDAAGLLQALEHRQQTMGTPDGQMAFVAFTDKFREKIGEEERDILLGIWNDPAIQNIWETRGDVQVQDAFEYFMNNIDRIASKEWEPTNQDILRARARTSGVTFDRFKIAKAKFEMYDVGGQRNERRKWIHYFDGVTTVLFVAAISEYNQVLFEDPSVNRQDEAVELFRKQLELENFLDTPFILFLNKNDLFRQKLTQARFRVDDGDTLERPRNTDFEGPHIDMKKSYGWENENSDPDYEACYKAAAQYLIKLYQSQAPTFRGANGAIYPNLTNSIDTDNINKIMTNCKDLILREHLFHDGF